MFAQRAVQQSLRRVAATANKPSVTSQMMFKQAIVPFAPISSIQTRPATTQVITPKDSLDILAKQRLNRPTAPHLTIYKPQITTVMSIAHRITGSALSGGFYILGLTYLASPLLGISMDSASMAAAFASWPLLAKISTKFIFAFPFTYHSFNGVRHLIWDTASQFKNQQVIRTGLFVLGLSVTSALGLAILV